MKGNLRKWWHQLTLQILLLGVLFFPTAAIAARMEGIEFASLPGGRTEIRMTFDSVPPDPVGYAIERPARIALDLEGVTSGLAAKHHQLDSGNAKSVSVIEAGDRTRVIVSLNEFVPYTASVVGNSLHVLVGKDNAGPGAANAGSARGATNVGSARDDAQGPGLSEAASPAITEVDFRRGELGEGRVIVKLSDAGVAVDVASEGGDIRVAFADTAIPPALRRKLDVAELATPVRMVDAIAEGGNAVIIVKPAPETAVDYLAYQADKTFTVEVRPLAQAGVEPASGDFPFRGDPFRGDPFRGDPFRGEKLSLNFQDIELRAVLQLIADFTDFNLVASDTVAGRITLRLKNVPWDQALDIILKTRGLGKRQEGNVLMVMPAAELAARDQQEIESRRQLSELEPLATEFIEVKYANAADVFGLFEQSGEREGGDGGVISSRGSVIVDERTNSIIITETAQRISAFRAVLDRLDVPVRQVLIEARIVTANSTFSRSIGVRWGALGANSHNDGELLSQWGGSLTTVAEIRGAAGQGGQLPLSSDDSLIVDLGRGGRSSFAVGLLDKSFLLELEIDALETEGNGEVIARPKVITADKRQASIASGSQIPYQEAASSGATSTSFVDAVLGFTVTPRITPDDRIIMDLDVTQDSIGEIFNGVPSINTNSIKTQVLVSDGETIVLGGVFNTTTAEGVSRTPFLGGLPWVGNLFKSRTKTEAKNELLIFITPRLLREPSTAELHSCPPLRGSRHSPQTPGTPCG